MQSTRARDVDQIEHLKQRIHDDPWSLTLDERQAVARASAEAQSAWQSRLAALVEPPLPDDRFPAFLLELPRFASLVAGIGSAARRSELDTSTADALQRFADLYRGYLVSEAPEHPDS